MALSSYVREGSERILLVISSIFQSFKVIVVVMRFLAVCLNGQTQCDFTVKWQLCISKKETKRTSKLCYCKHLNIGIGYWPQLQGKYQLSLLAGKMTSVLPLFVRSFLHSH